MKALIEEEKLRKKREDSQYSAARKALRSIMTSPTESSSSHQTLNEDAQTSEQPEVDQELINQLASYGANFTPEVEALRRVQTNLF